LTERDGRVKDADLIWQIAVVRCDDDGSRWLEFNDPGSCHKCSSGTGCGAALFSRLFARPDARVPMLDDEDIPADRMVRVGLDPRWLMLAAAATYLLPIIAFIAGAVLSDQLWPEATRWPCCRAWHSPWSRDCLRVTR
jgi:positive regulator of sigma E activity